MKKILIALSILTTAFAGCLSSGLPDKPVKPGAVQPADVASYFIADNPPVKNQVIGNPLQYGSQRIGLDLDSFELPRAHEGMYRLACRLPVIDYVATRPLYMKQWAEDTTDLINKYHRQNGSKIVDYALEILRGTTDFPAFDDNYDTGAYDNLAKPLSRMNFTPKYQEALLKLYRSYLIACKINQGAKKNLTEEDKRFFSQNPAYFLAPDGKRMPSVTGNVDSHFLFIEHSRRAAYENIFYAAKILAEAVQDYVSATKSFKKEDFFADQARTAEVYNFSTSYGLVVLAGTADNNHQSNASLLIDLGGNDIYANNAGGSYYAPEGIALCIDHSGDDYYNAPDKQYVQGCGILGTGYLVDMDGNDKYFAKHFSQACGIMGVGIIWDINGNDIYDGHTFCQGAGMFGLGLLLDNAGTDIYDAATIAQGAATTLGLGILSDLQGDDSYQIAINTAKDNLNADLTGFSQGGALSFRASPWSKKLTAYGGIGILNDYQGNDAYKNSGVLSQGGSYIMSLGVLVDYFGNDYYSCQEGNGSCVHISNAISIDKNGDDIYEGKWGAGGVGGDRSIGIFIDYSGNDSYGANETSASYGTARKPFGFGLFIDYAGQDKYLCKKTDQVYEFDSFGGVLPDPTANSWPFAICLDLAGNDDYQVKNRTNNAERLDFGHGIHIDTEWQGQKDVIGKIANPLPPYRDFSLPESVTKSPYYNDIKSLQNPDVFARFQSIGRLTGNLGAIPYLVSALMDSGHIQFNRDAMECLHYFLVRNQVTGEYALELAKLLNARDEEVRILMAHNLGWWEFRNCEDKLIETLEKDRSGQVRRFALAALLNLKSAKAVPLVQKLALSDPTEDVRRLSVTFLGMIAKSNSLETILKALDQDSAAPVRIAAAEAFTNFQDERAIAPLRKAARSDDIYLRRAAAKSLAIQYQLDAIGILIDSLSFPSLDTGENYGSNLINYIAAYAGFDLPKSERYDRARWTEWYQKNKDRIDIRKNIDSYMRFNELAASISGDSNEAKIRRYEEFLAKYPDYKPARESLGSLLNQIAWDMVTADKASPAYNAEQGLRHAVRAVQLTPTPAILDTLAEAYYANGQIDSAIELCREELKKNPDEKMFKDRLEKYLREKSR